MLFRSNYLIIEQNIVTNVVLWNGDTTQWTPPQGSLAIIQATTPALNWALSPDKTTYVLQEQIGSGGIGFTWDGSILTTDLPQPPDPKPQPQSNGTITA